MKLSGKALIIFLLFVGALTLKAATYYTATTSNLVEIDEHSTCKKVTNNNAKDMFIPTNTSAEWADFIANTPSNVTVEECGITCPSGYSQITGRADNRTMDFCVMEYEAKDVSGTATSQAALTPWVSITLEAARDECLALGTGYDVMTNDQWTTMARDFENVAANWSGGSIGSGCLYTGNNGDVSDCGYDGSDPEYGTGRDTKARLEALSGDYVWDANANVAEQIRGYRQIGGDTSYHGAYGASVITGALRDHYGPSGTYTPTGCVGDNSSLGQCGLGWYYLLNDGADDGMMRGGEYGDANSDLFYTHMGQGGGSGYAYVGFRCVNHPDYNDWLTFSNPSPASNGNFESGDFSGGWYHVGWDDDNWVIDSTTKYAGSYAAGSPTTLANNEQACIERAIDLTLESNDHRVQWVWKVSTEKGYDWARATLDSENKLPSSGEIDWHMEYMLLEAGSSYTLRFCYIKDGSATEGSDRVWLDNFDIIEIN